MQSAPIIIAQSPVGRNGRLVVHDRECHLDIFRPLAIGDTVEVIRGNGPREGDHMGIATVTAFEDGVPTLVVHFDGGVGAERA
jgi:hypothetical protein